MRLVLTFDTGDARTGAVQFAAEFRKIFRQQASRRLLWQKRNNFGRTRATIEQLVLW